jgi:hypothetical protein
MTPFHPSDIVRITRLDAPERDVDSVGDPAPLPRIGEMARVVTQVDAGLYLIERTTDDGRVIWTAEFMERELELIEPNKAMED